MKSIPNEVFRPVFERLVQEEEALHILAARCGVHADSLHAALDREEINFDLADLLLCKLGVPYLWREKPLSPFYADIEQIARGFKDPDGRLRCARPGCVVMFRPKRKGQKYCDPKCCDYHYKMRASHTHQNFPSDALRYVCRNGLHERSPENTYTAPNGHRTCLPCRRVSSKRANDKRKVASVA